MEIVSSNIIMLVTGLVILSIVMIWWSSSLMLGRRTVKGGMHVFLIGCIVAYDAGIIFYGVMEALDALGLMACSLLVMILSWFYELKLRREEGAQTL